MDLLIPIQNKTLTDPEGHFPDAKIRRLRITRLPNHVFRVDNPETLQQSHLESVLIQSENREI